MRHSPVGMVSDCLDRVPRRSWWWSWLRGSVPVIPVVAMTGTAGAITEGQLPGNGGPAAANQYYGYPYADPPACSVDGGACVLDSWDFNQGQCTSWVADPLNELNGVAFNDSFDGQHWGDATN